MRSLPFAVFGVVAVLAACCGDSDGDAETVTAVGLAEFELPDGWSVIVPTHTDDELIPVLSVGKREDEREESVSVAIFHGRQWDSPQAAAEDWAERSLVDLQFEQSEEDGISHLRAEAPSTDAERPSGDAMVDILAVPGSPDEIWLVLLCGSGPGRMEQAREACDRVLNTLEPWSPAAGG